MFIKRETVDPIAFDGLEILDYTAGRDGSSSLAEVTVPAGISHKHSYSNRSDKYYYIVRGRLRFTLGDQVRDLNAGDVCLVPRGERFTYTNNGPGTAKLVLVHTPDFKLDCEVFEDT